jgi:PAS domain S-box-containing protein
VEGEAVVDSKSGRNRGGVEQNGETMTDRFRSVAQLNMLHSLAAKLNSLGDLHAIGAAITAELRTIIDYHNCRVYLLEDDGISLAPVAFRGDLFTDYEKETLEGLRTKVGEGMTGRVAASKTSLLTPDAREIDFAITIPGTPDILESMLLVPMLVGDEVIGVIVLSSLGYGKFDEEDQRLLEVLASHAAVAFENAKLLHAERNAAAASTALLRMSQALTRMKSVGDILQESIETVPTLVRCVAIGAYVRDSESGAYRLARILGVDPTFLRPRSEIAEIPSALVAQYVREDTEPFTVDKKVVSEVQSDLLIVREPRDVLVAPLRWERDGYGALLLVAPKPDGHFDVNDLRLARGIADITSLALGNARRLSELERFHELVESLDAVFWEADARTRTFSFVGGRTDELLGPDASDWPSQGRVWGDHILPDDREDTIEASRNSAEAGENHSVEYRIRTPDGRTTWIRDVVKVVRGAQGSKQLRGLMVDVTERKRAEQALRKSERKYSEAFKREREAAQRLRALDDMKNTFLEAVSHDLRTPLTSILGSALTLEQSQLGLPREDALDLVRRIAANARKLERLLSDLLDLDRLQRGIVSPQRRPTDLEAIVQRGVAETENLAGREILVEVEQLTVSIDAAKVERILENLISNALRHTPNDAHIWLRARGQDGGVLIVVEDDGPGVPSELHEAVFEPFRQAPGSSSGHSPGVGVGLSLVLRFAELHGGRAWLENRPGGGSSFRVFLPGG